MKTFRNSVLALAATTMAATAVHAGGFSTEGVNPGGVLFNDKSFVIQGAVGYAMPQRRYTNATGTQQDIIGGPVPATGSSSSDATPNYFLLSGDLKFGLTEEIDCAIRGHQPYKLDNEVDPGFNGEYVQDSFKIDAFGVDATCSYKFDIGNGRRLRMIGGVRSTDLEASRTNQASAAYLGFVGGIFPEITSPAPGPDYTNDYSFEADRGYGYRVGASFEIPQYALRAQVIYDSKISLDLKGTQRIYLGGVELMNQAATLDVDMPQSISARFQTGINPTTLVFGGVRWMDWSDISMLNIIVAGPSNPALNKTLVTGWSDGWTIEGGVQKKLTDDFSGSFGLKWDKGIGGGYTDTWSANAGVAYDIDDNWRVSLGGSISLLTSSTETSGFPAPGDSPGGGLSGSSYKQGNDWAYSIGTRLQYSMQ
ncbi:MAG: outer membrane protein transport protein [Rhizobiaceae bacterium]